jgi:hypothetical protein
VTGGDVGHDERGLYLAASAADAAGSAVFRMSPDRWLTSDFAKQFG